MSLFTRTTRSLAGKNKARLQVENLEDRQCMSTMVGMAGSTVTITGDHGANKVRIEQDDAMNTFKVFFDGANGTMQSRTFRSDQVSRINANLKGGPDTFRFDGIGDFTRAKIFDVKLGHGNDRAEFFTSTGGITGSNAVMNPATIRTNLSIDIDASRDNDRVVTHFGTMQNANVRVNAMLGHGNDEFNPAIWGDLIGSTSVSIEGHGHEGADMLHYVGRRDQLNSQWGLDMAAAASLAINLDGGAGNDIVRARGEGMMHGTVNLHLEGGGGSDTGTFDPFAVPPGVSVQWKLYQGSTASLNTKLFGDLDPMLHRPGQRGNGNDRIQVDITDLSGGLARLSTLIDGGAGTDTLVGTPPAGTTVVRVP